MLALQECKREIIGHFPSGFGARPVAVFMTVKYLTLPFGRLSNCNIFDLRISYFVHRLQVAESIQLDGMECFILMVCPWSLAGTLALFLLT